MSRPTITIQEKLSWVPLRIQMRFNTLDLSVGTGFFYLHNSKSYLVTNWHNVTGRNSIDMTPLSPQLALPNLTILPIPYNAKCSDGRDAVQWKYHEFKLYENETPVWYEHPVHGHNVDAVAIPLDGLEDTKIIAANDKDALELEDVILRPSLDAYVLGYPLGITGGANFPVWKRASVASEPDIDLENLPKFIIDTATREGMSGSPVFVQTNGFFIPEGKSGLENGILGEARRFAGVYSGRLGADTFQAQLGIVWKEKAIIEIIEGMRPGQSSFET